MKATPTTEALPGGDIRHRLLIAVAVLLVGGVLLARLWRAAEGEPASMAPESMLVQAGAELQQRALDLAKMDVPLETLTAEGEVRVQPILADELRRNQVVVLNFWATWCPPCLDELRSLYEFARVVTPLGVRVVAVSYDEDWAVLDRVWREYLGTAEPRLITWARDPAGQDGAPESMMRLRFGTEKLPETYVLAGGRVLARFVGPQDWSRPGMKRAFEATVAAAQ